MRILAHVKPSTVLLALVLVNIRSAPFAHNLRFLLQALQTAYSLRNRKRVLVTPTKELKVLPPYDDVWATRTLRYRVWPDDVDMNIHMNNSHYNKNLDFARTDWALAIFGGKFLKEAKIHNAGVMTFFRRELKPFQQFDIETRLLTYGECVLTTKRVGDGRRELHRVGRGNGRWPMPVVSDPDTEGKRSIWGKWVYVEHRFKVNTTVHCLAITKIVFKQRSGKTIPFADVLLRLGYAHETEAPEVTKAREEKRKRGWKVAESLLAAEEAAFGLDVPAIAQMDESAAEGAARSAEQVAAEAELEMTEISPRTPDADFVAGP
ncbi:hypothetical protein HK104_007610 [Borealophlyctis nickersoniae]|nr:hypothetical protein HK104_007610 [Borealophlyctis nickersoniae]